VAALLVLARLAQQQRFARTLRFVAFVNEEPPYFQSAYMGSRVYASESAQRGEQITAMLSLETIGYYSDEKGSQSYPFPLNFVYSSPGNFIGFVGNLASRRLVRRVVAAFREHARFPSEAVAAPSIIPGIGWSDHWSFWQEGYPGVMVTDTAPYRYEQYHTPRDTPEIIDYERTARVVGGLGHVLGDLAGVETR
jgi:Zn-dependent M28 family amino/carboxypeptidase